MESLPKPKPTAGEWEENDEQSLQKAIGRLPVPEHEVRTIDARWRRLRKRAQDPAELIGWKY